jgi:hypothetical protein
MTAPRDTFTCTPGAAAAHAHAHADPPDDDRPRLADVQTPDPPPHAHPAWLLPARVWMPRPCGCGRPDCLFCPVEVRP